MATLIITCLVLSLTSNLVPVVNVTALLALFPLRLFWSRREIDPRLAPRRAIHFLIAAYIFWTFSYLLTTAPISNFFSYDFLRYDGAIFIGYLPLILFRDSGIAPKTVKRLIWGYLGILSLAAGLGAIEFVTHVEGLQYDYEEGVGLHWNVLEKSSLSTDIFHGWYRAHNAAGSLYGMAACISLALYLGRPRTKAFSWHGLIFAAVLTGMILAQSRSGYVAFAAASMAVFVRKKEHARILVRLGALVVVPLLLFWLSQSIIMRRVTWITNFEDPNVAGRLVAYADATADFLRSPLIGIGFGRFNDDWKTYAEVPPIVSIATQGEIVNLDNHAHNSYLHFMAEGGVVGLVLMVGIWIETYRWASSVRRRFGELSDPGILAQGIQGCVVIILFFSLTEHAMGTALGPLTAFTMVGLLRNLVSCEQHSIASLGAAVDGTAAIPRAGVGPLIPRGSPLIT